MGMTKAEKAEMQELKKQLRMREVVQFLPRIPPDIPRPRSGEPDTEGWMFNAYSHKVWPARSNCAVHYQLDEIGGKKLYSGTQGGASLYSTKELAIEAMVRESVWMLAAELVMKLKEYE